MRPSTTHAARTVRPARLVLAAGALLVAGSMALPACNVGSADAASGTITLYCGRSEGLVGPLLERFEEQTGIDLRVVYGESTAALAQQLRVEGEDSPADAFFSQDVGYLGMLAEAGTFAALDEDTISVVPASLRDVERRWAATSARARVLVYNPTLIAEEDLPDSLAELADARYDSVGWAPTNSSMQAHVSVLRHAWGEAETRRWLAAIHDGGATRYAKNAPQVVAANGGEIAIGWVNHYYLHKLLAEGEVDEATAANYSFRVDGDPGNILMPSGVAIVAHSPRKQLAARLVEFLLSEVSQEYFATQTYEYPAREGVAAAPGLPSLDALNLAEVNPEWLIDLDATNDMLRELGLQ